TRFAFATSGFVRWRCPRPDPSLQSLLTRWRSETSGRITVTGQPDSLVNAGVLGYHNPVPAQNSLKLLPALGLAATALFALALGWLCWQAWFDPAIRFFPPGTAPWIVYPSPPRVHTFAVQSLPALFRRQFVLERQPSKALLDWRSFAAGRLSVNGQRAHLPAVANWKNLARIDIS